MDKTFYNHSSLNKNALSVNTLKVDSKWTKIEIFLSLLSNLYFSFLYIIIGEGLRRVLVQPSAQSRVSYQIRVWSLNHQGWRLFNLSGETVPTFDCLHGPMSTLNLSCFNLYPLPLVLLPCTTVKSLAPTPW